MNVDYPFHVDARGRTAEASDEDHMRDMIEQVLFTAPGERVNRPTFGSGVMQLTDAAGEFVNPRWSPDGTKIMCARRLGDMNLVIFPAPT